MADDWKVGDLAVCVDAKPIRIDGQVHKGGGGKLEVGKIYAVDGSGVDPRGAVLWLSGVSSGDSLSNGAFLAIRFRKIRPDEPIACETEFRILLDLSKKRVKA